MDDGIPEYLPEGGGPQPAALRLAAAEVPGGEEEILTDVEYPPVGGYSSAEEELVSHEVDEDLMADGYGEAAGPIDFMADGDEGVARADEVGGGYLGGCEGDELTEDMVDELATFEFPEEPIPDQDPTGRLAYKKKCEEFDFFMFPIHSVTEKFDLEVLSLAHSGLGDKGSIALAEGLKINNRIRELCLVENWITPVGGKALLEAVQRNPNVCKLDLSENRLGYRAGSMGSSGIGPMIKDLLKTNAALKEISLRANKIGDKDMVAICDGLCENFSLYSIDLSYNELGPQGGECVGTMLGTNADLRELNLEWNQLRNLGTMAVLNGLKQNNVLKKISLAWNGVSDKGGMAVGEVLHGNTSLEEVDVSHNRVGEQGAVKIAEGIQENAAIKKLNLAYNPLRDTGCTAIIAAIRNNSSLVYVDLKSTESGHNASKEIQETKKKKGNKVEILIPRSLFIPKGLGL